MCPLSPVSPVAVGQSAGKHYGSLFKVSRSLCPIHMVSTLPGYQCRKTLTSAPDCFRYSLLWPFFNKSSNLFASLDDVECKSHWHLSSFDSLPPSRPHQLAASVIGAATLQHKSRQEQTRDKGTRKLFDFEYDAQYDPPKACCD